MRLLDCFSGAGGAAMGYHRAGFTDVLGVDCVPQPRYPFRFHQADALEFLRGVRPGDFDLIHASPPCQGYSRMRHLPWLKGREWPLLIEETRQLLQATGTPYVIENVEGAPLDGITLCGATLGLKVYRHRRFEGSHALFAPPHQPHREVIGSGRMLNDRARGSDNGFVSTIRGDVGKARRAFGIDWMTRAELSQAIPPAYTAFIGSQLLQALGASPAPGALTRP